ncbi:MAG: helix-turn-helix transcriptional regulator [bacterium]
MTLENQFWLGIIIANGNSMSKVIIVKLYYNVKGNVNHSTIVKNIKKYRAKRCISQDKLSKLANITLHTITKIESGTTPDPRIETVKKIADALGVSIDDLMRN